MLTTIHAPLLRASPSDAAPAHGSGASANDPAGFASLLRQTRAAPAPAPMPAPSAPAPVASSAPAPAPAPTSSTEPKSKPADEADDPAGAPSESDATSRTRALLKGKLRAADGAVPSGSVAKPIAKAASEPSPATLGDTPNETRTAAGPQALPTGHALDPSLMHLIAHLQRTPTAERGDAGTAGPAPADESQSATSGPRAADAKAAADLNDGKLAPGKPHPTDATAPGQFAEMLTEERRSPLRGEPVIVTDARKSEIAAVGANAAGALPPASGTDTGNAAATTAAIATPVAAPDFAQELGLRLSVFAKDGVQTAELHLNPADMGPVSVQIVMDGTQARIDFGADMAATRHAIEAGLPELASALRDAGFTLAGGGVSQHGGGRAGHGDRGESQGDGRRRDIAVQDDVKRVASAARRIVSQGGVDLFA